MGTTLRSTFAFDNTFVRDLPGLSRPWQAAPAPEPRLLVLNDDLAAELGVDADALHEPEGIAILVGNAVPPGAEPVAMAYAGHQFGSLNPRLGDGRALLLGEVVDRQGRRRDLHLKGSGRTPFARGGDGKAAVGPMLREHLIGEAMHGLGIPTTRALSVVATGEPVARETMLPGAVLARVAASHLRVGTFQYAAMAEDPALVGDLARYAIARHHPEAADAPEPHLALLEAVVEAQASLIARWMLVGFVHGVMNTDNMTISGETIDYGPCAFVDAHDLATVFSSIDHGGRYAYGNQPQVAVWNLARLAEALLPLIADDPEAAVGPATEVLEGFAGRHRAHWLAGMRAKVGLGPDDERPGDTELVDDLEALLRAQAVDHTSFLRSLSATVRGSRDRTHALLADPAAFDAWSDRHLARLEADERDAATIAAAMDAVNPVYVPRNHLVEEALAAATDGDLGPYERLVEVVSSPFEERPGLGRHAEPAPEAFGESYQTFCGT
jgi:uncharacterized protein YdiU (UPF0061 family)